MVDKNRVDTIIQVLSLLQGDRKQKIMGEAAGNKVIKGHAAHEVPAPVEKDACAERFTANVSKLLDELLEYDGGIGSAETKGIRHGDAYGLVSGDIGHIVQIACFILVFIIYGGRNDAVMNGKA